MLREGLSERSDSSHGGFAVQLCSRKEGIGVGLDGGVVTLSPDQRGHCLWEILKSDEYLRLHHRAGAEIREFEWAC